LKLNIRKEDRLPIYGLVLLFAGMPLAAFGSHGGANGGGGNGGGGNGGGGGGKAPVTGTAQDVCSIVAPGGQPTQILPGTVLIRETFGFGPGLARPQGGNGTLRQVTIGTDLSGFWAEQPCNNTAVWMQPSGSGVQSWTFSESSTDPKEAPSSMMPSELGNGSLSVHLDPETVLEYPVALVPFQAPPIPYEVSVDTVSPGPLGGWVEAGFTSSNALNNNFESAGQAWIRVQYTRQLPYIATVELHTNGLNGLMASATFPADASDFDTLTVRYDPTGKTVTGFFNGRLVGTIAYDASSARFTGIEGAGTVDNFELKASE
jgi:hypothetical protein